MLENRNSDNECYLGHCLCSVVCFSHQLFGLKEALEVLHLPDAGDDEDDGLSDGPPQNTLVRALARHAETLLTVPLVVLLFLDLLHLVQELSDPQLQLRQFVFGCDLWVVVGVFTNLNVQVDSQFSTCKQCHLGGVGVEADLMLSWCV